MASKRNQAAAAPTAAERESGGATLTPAGDKQASPRVGRTPGTGAKAERPSEGRDRKVEPKPVEPTRTKAPSPSAANRPRRQQGQRKAH